MTPSLIAITGPTASGKSEVADLVAERLGSPVISADSMQVYRGMDIGTAKTPVAERRVPLLMVDLVDPVQPYSAALYQRDAREIIDGLLSRGMVPVLAGGTGLYLRAALDEMDFPRGEVGGHVRSRYEDVLERRGGAALFEMLRERDPKSADVIHPHNVRRVIRALEMCDEGVSYAEQKDGFGSPVAHYPYHLFALTMDRAELYRRIDARVDRMIASGLVDEVRALVEHGAADALTSRQAIGYKEIIDALAGKITMGEAVDLIKRRSRRYAKRQLSWCRGDARTEWLDIDELGVTGAAQAILDRSTSALPDHEGC